MTSPEHFKGNVKELWKVSFPLMLSYLSLFAMIFVDRVFLAKYSTQALNSAVQAGTLAWSFIIAGQTLLCIGEVFVAQYNGARRHGEIGKPIWQMIWLALFFAIIFVAFALWGTQLIYSEDSLEYAYFQAMTLAAPFFCLYHALAPFYIGRGKTPLVTWLVILGNVVNVILDPILIFGIDGYVPSLGIVGAAIATGIGALVQCVIISIMFLSKHNRENFGTNNFKIDVSLLKSCLKIGCPPAIFIFLEMLGWAFFYNMMAQAGEVHIFITGVCQSVLLPFYFFGLGIEKGSTAIAGNMIGAKQIDSIKKLSISGLKLIGYFIIALSLILIIYPEPIMACFLNDGILIDPNTFVSIEVLHRLLRYGFIMVILYIALESVRCLAAGLLTAAGDTLFLMISGSLSVWFFLILPTYFFVVKLQGTVRLALLVWVLFSFVIALTYYLRFLQGKWKTKKIH